METRLQGLLQYLSLLNEMDNGSLPFSMYEQKKVVCSEIEKELWIGEPEMASDYGEGENEGTADFIQVIVNMQKQIESLEKRLNYIETNKSAAEDIASKVREQLRKQDMYRQAKVSLTESYNKAVEANGEALKRLNYLESNKTLKGNE